MMIRKKILDPQRIRRIDGGFRSPWVVLLRLWCDLKPPWTDSGAIYRRQRWPDWKRPDRLWRHPFSSAGLAGNPKKTTAKRVHQHCPNPIYQRHTQRNGPWLNGWTRTTVNTACQKMTHRHISTYSGPSTITCNGWNRSDIPPIPWRVIKSS